MMSIITKARNIGGVLAIAAAFGLSLLVGGSASATTADPAMNISVDPIYTTYNAITFDFTGFSPNDTIGLCWKTTNSTLPAPDLNNLASAGNGHQMMGYCLGLGLTPVNVTVQPSWGSSHVLRATSLNAYTQYSVYPVLWNSANDTINMKSYTFYTSEFINPGDNPTLEGSCAFNCVEGTGPRGRIGLLHSTTDATTATMTTDPYGVGVDSTSFFFGTNHHKFYRYCYSTNSADLWSVPVNDDFCTEFQDIHNVPPNTPIHADVVGLTPCTKYYYRFETKTPNPFYSHIYSFWTTCETPQIPPQTCENGASNYPACDDNEPKVCENGASNYPICDDFKSKPCENGATNYPACDNNQGSDDATSDVPNIPGTSDPGVPNAGTTIHENGGNTGAAISSVIASIASAALIVVMLAVRKSHRKTTPQS